MYDIALQFMGKIKNMRALLTLHFVEQYVNGATFQWERIQEDKSKLPGPGPRVDARLIQTLFLDVHFYFVCGEKVKKLYKEFIEIDGGKDLKDLWAKHKHMFKKLKIARDHLEHIDERVQDESHRDFGNLMGDTYIFWGEKFDISRSALGELEAAYEELIEMLRLRYNVKPN